MKLRITFLYILALIITNSPALAQTPVANFNANTVSGCSPLIVDFQDQSSNDVTEWEWDFGNGGISNKKNPSAIYFNTGTYTVRLTVKNGSGASNTITKTAFITVVTEPVVNFTTDKNSGCSPAVIQFTDLSTTPPGTNITTWKWDFGDGGTSTQKNPVYSYRTPGSYTVTLSIGNDKGCTKLITRPNLIDVGIGVKPSISFVDPNVCSAPATITFNSNSIGPGTLSYAWRLENGQTSNNKSITTTYNANGNYGVTLTVMSSFGCFDSITRRVDIGKATTDFIIPASICPKTPAQFLNNSTPRPISAKWIFSNGTTDNNNNGLTIFQNPGTYTVTLINTYLACVDTLVKTITVATSPPISFTASDTAKCQPSLTVNFNNTTTGTSFNWDFGDSTVSNQSNPSHTYTNYGDYDVTLIATGNNGCIDTLVKPAFIKIRKPVISFAGLPAANCVPFNFNFKAIVDTIENVTSYNWDFGDGSAGSTLESPSHIYAVQGTYPVTLTITTSSGCTETFSLPNAIKVGTIPTPDFVADITNACGDPGIQLTNLSTGATEFLWTFSDGSSSTDPNPQHIFADTGWVSVTLTAINNGCQDSITKIDYVYIQPSISKFDYRPDCNNKLEYTFTDKSIGANSWEWNFGDGTTYSGQNPPTHVFPGDGSYIVSLLTTNAGCSYTLSRTIVIKDHLPNFTSENTVGCKSFRPRFNIVNPDPTFITKYLWDFGDGVERDGAVDPSSMRFRFTEAGNYNVKLTSIDTFGCRHSITKNNFIRVNGPKAYFNSTNSNGCKGLITSFNDSTITDGINAIVNWKWDFGDQTIQSFTAPPFEHQYDSIGDYDIKLVVTDAAGCRDSTTLREFVKISILKADWVTNGETCPKSPIAFTDKTTSDLPFTSIWDFGDGKTATTRNSSHQYIDTGKYTVKLVVKDIMGCQDSLVKTDIVYVGLPVASFTANNFDTYCLPFEAKFINTSTYANSFSWNLTAATSTQRNPSLYYTSPGNYPITLIATSPGGCKDTATNNLVVHDADAASINYNPLIGCRPLSVDFQAFTAMNGRFIWDFGDGNVVDTNINIYTHLYDNFGAFIPKIILREPEGCLITLTGDESIQINGARAKFEITNLLFCDSGYVNILDSTTSRDMITKYTWDFGDGSISNSSVPVHNYTSPGIYPVSLSVETETGCRDSMTYQLPVKVVQSPLIAITGDSVICVNERLNVNGIFLRADTSVVSWSWEFGNGNRSSLQNPDPQQYVPGDYSIYSVATNSSGCKDSIQRDIRINPLPVINVTSPLTKVVGISIPIPVTYSSNLLSYTWLPTNGLSCTDCPEPITNTKYSIDYVISVVDSNSCLNAEQVRVIVICKGAEIFIPNTFSPNGDGSNDFFYPRGRGIERIRTLRIFNRWGEVVFENREFPINDQLAGWDGKYKNGAPQAGVYVYQAELICENGEILTYKGNIALIL